MPRHALSALTETTRNRLFADEQRRFIIESLPTVGRDDITLDEFVAQLEEAENVQADSLQRLRIRLHHVHLPMLDEAGLLEYDGATKRVTLDSPRAVATPAE